MIISFDKAYKILDNCSAVVWGEHFLTYPGLHDEESDTPETDLFLELETVDSEGLEYKASFFRGANQQVRVEGSSMFLVNDDGDEEQLTILEPAKDLGIDKPTNVV